MLAAGEWVSRNLLSQWGRPAKFRAGQGDFNDIGRRVTKVSSIFSRILISRTEWEGIICGQWKWEEG